MPAEAKPNAQAFAVALRQAISRQLLLACSRQQLTPGQLAKRADIPLSTLNNVLNCQSINPGVLTLLGICNGLGLRLDELIQAAWQQAQASLPPGGHNNREAQELEAIIDEPNLK